MPAKDMEENKDNAEGQAPDQQPPQNPNIKWYILHAYSGFERKVRESIGVAHSGVRLEGQDRPRMIPTEPVTEIVNGKKHTIERCSSRLRAGRDGSRQRPLARREDHAPGDGLPRHRTEPRRSPRKKYSRSSIAWPTPREKPRLKIKFEKNESVRITDGPFANFNGVVDEVNEDRETLKVMVTIFGRSTPVELEFGKVEKVLS